MAFEPYIVGLVPPTDDNDPAYRFHKEQRMKYKELLKKSLKSLDTLKEVAGSSPEDAQDLAVLESILYVALTLAAAVKESGKAKE